MTRREFIAILCGAAVRPRAVRAEGGSQSLIPLLIDLPGWTGSEPGSTERERKGRRILTAGRSYLRGDARFNALISSGTAADAADRKGNVYLNFRGAQRSRSSIDGFEVMTESTPVFVLIAITLGPDAMFNLFFNNISPDEAMAIARMFDWKSIQAHVNQ